MPTTAIRFIKLDPTQNMTILVKDPVPRAKQKDVANALLRTSHVHAEQAGFIEPPENPEAWARLQMMGGEFCGNATMSLAAVFARDKGISPGERLTVPLEVSGAEQLLYCEITVGDGHYTGRVDMPLPDSLAQVEFDMAGRTHSGWLVHMPGISHLIVNPPDSAEEKELFVEEVLAKIGDFTTQEALGIMFYAEGRLEPFVYVKPMGTKVWEHCCGSGSAAVAACAAVERQADTDLFIAQPGGTLRVTVGFDGGITGIAIEGVCRIVAEGTAYIEEDLL